MLFFYLSFNWAIHVFPKIFCLRRSSKHIQLFAIYFFWYIDPLSSKTKSKFLILSPLVWKAKMTLSIFSLSLNYDISSWNDTLYFRKFQPNSFQLVFFTLPCAASKDSVNFFRIHKSRVLVFIMTSLKATLGLNISERRFSKTYGAIRALAWGAFTSALPSQPSSCDSSSFP